MSTITPPPSTEPVDLSETTGQMEDIPSPSAQEMLAQQQAAMRERELAAQERQARKFGTYRTPLPVGDNGSYRWQFSDNGNAVELHNIPAELADDLSALLGKHDISYTRYQQVSEWRPQ